MREDGQATTTDGQPIDQPHGTHQSLLLGHEQVGIFSAVVIELTPELLNFRPNFVNVRRYLLHFSILHLHAGQQHFGAPVKVIVNSILTVPLGHGVLTRHHYHGQLFIDRVLCGAHALLEGLGLSGLRGLNGLWPRVSDKIMRRDFRRFRSKAFQQETTAAE